MNDIEVDTDDNGYILMEDGRPTWMRKEYIQGRHRNYVSGEYDENENLYGFDNDQWMSLSGRSGLVEIKNKRIIDISVSMMN